MNTTHSPPRDTPAGNRLTNSLPGRPARRLPWLPALVLLLPLVLSSPAADVSAEFLYSSNGATIAITSYIGNGGKVSIPETIGGLPVREIRESAFARNAAVTRIALPSDVTHIASNAFQGCAGLLEISIAANHPRFRSLDGVLFNRDVTALLHYPSGRCGSCSLPDTVTRIGSNAFEGCAGLTGVAIPSNVGTIGARAFAGCTGLTRIALPDRLASIGECAFEGCTALNDVDIPDSVIGMGAAAFAQCTGLVTATIGNGLSLLDESAFSGCSGLVHAIIGSSVTDIEKSAFAGCSGLAAVVFTGDAPAIRKNAFYGAPADFAWLSLDTRSGFPTPAWRGRLSLTLQPAAAAPPAASLAAGSRPISYFAAGEDGKSYELRRNSTAVGSRWKLIIATAPRTGGRRPAEWSHSVLPAGTAIYRSPR